MALTRIIACTLLVSVSTPALAAQNKLAQDTLAPEGFQDIVVTARRQAENIQTTPVAVTAVTTAALERAQIDDIADIQRLAPNLTISTSSPGSAAAAFLSIRGETNLAGSVVNDNAIGVYIDGVYIARAAGTLLDLVDVERVEVLRGPQGTLFGRNTTGGALSITNIKPHNMFEGSAQVRAGSYGLIETTGILNVPLGDAVAARLVARHSEHDGYVRRTFGGDRLNDNNGEFYRAAVRVAPLGASWDFTVSGDITRRESSGQAALLTAFNPNPLLNGLIETNPPVENPGGQDTLAPYLHPPVGFYTSVQGDPTANRLRGEGISGTLNIDFGDVRLQSITAYRHMRADTPNDTDGTPYLILSGINLVRQKQYSEEIQLSGKVGPISWMGGLYLFTEDAFESSRATNFLISPARSAAQVWAKNSSIAPFAQLNWQITDRLRATGGLRYTFDRRKATLRNFANEGAPTTGPASLANCRNSIGDIPPNIPNGPDDLCRLPLKKDFEYPSYLLSIDFELSDDIFLYAKTSRADMAGGFNYRISSPAAAFGPESVRDVEVGAKVDWIPGRLRTNLAFFYAWQKDVQRNANSVFNGFASLYTVNAGDAHVYGVEAELNAVPWHGMEVNGSFGYVRAKYTRFSETRDADPTTPGIQPIEVDRSGEAFPQVPKVTWSLGATQRLSAGYGDWSFHADYSYIGKQTFFDITASPGTSAETLALITAQRRAAVAPGYGLLNGRISLEIADSNMEVAFWGKNILGKKYYTRTFADVLNTPFGFATAYIGDPATYGVTATYRFGR